MLDFAHEDRLLPRHAPKNAGTCTGRFALADDALRHGAHSREAWVLAIKAQIAAGEYLTDAKLDAALEKMLDEVLA